MTVPAIISIGHALYTDRGNPLEHTVYLVWFDRAVGLPDSGSVLVHVPCDACGEPLPIALASPALIRSRLRVFRAIAAAVGLIGLAVAGAAFVARAEGASAPLVVILLLVGASMSIFGLQGAFRRLGSLGGAWLDTETLELERERDGGAGVRSQHAVKFKTTIGADLLGA